MKAIERRLPARWQAPYLRFWRLMVRWNRFDTPEGILSWQIGFNTLMLPALVVYYSQPWLALGLMVPLFMATVWLHGPRCRAAIGWYAVLGWIGEMWMVALGPVWVHSAPIEPGFWGGLTSGGWLGVPFFMLPAWGLVGALMLALQGYFNRPKG